MADEEDVALSAFNSLCVGAAKGRFPQVQDHDGLYGACSYSLPLKKPPIASPTRTARSAAPGKFGGNPHWFTKATVEQASNNCSLENPALRLLTFGSRNTSGY
jgi:hypothetical protein